MLQRAAVMERATLLIHQDKLLFSHHRPFVYPFLNCVKIIDSINYISDHWLMLIQKFVIVWI
jgi:hypothetical protein